jgi:hypothetical protein
MSNVYFRIHVFFLEIIKRLALVGKRCFFLYYSPINRCIKHQYYMPRIRIIRIKHCVFRKLCIYKLRHLSHKLYIKSLIQLFFLEIIKRLALVGKRCFFLYYSPINRCIKHQYYMCFKLTVLVFCFIVSICFFLRITIHLSFLVFCFSVNRHVV